MEGFFGVNYFRIPQGEMEGHISEEIIPHGCTSTVFFKVGIIVHISQGEQNLSHPIPGDRPKFIN